MSLKDELLKSKMTQHIPMAKVSQPKVGVVMHEFGQGNLHSGSQSGPKVKSHKQAVAIALAEAAKHKV